MKGLIKTRIIKQISKTSYKFYLNGYHSAKRGDKLLTEREFLEKAKKIKERFLV